MRCTLFKLLILGAFGLALGGCFERTALRAVIRTDPSPPRGPYPLTMILDGRSSVGPIEEWIWTIFGEGKDEPVTVLTGEVASHEFRERGRYRVYLEVRATGRFSQTEVLVDVRSKPPLAAFTADPYPEVELGKPVSFDAQNSYDPDGTIANYVWSFGDGTWWETDQPTITHTYQAVGEYSVQLVVEDDYGDRSEPVLLRIRVVPKGCGSCG